MDNDQLSKPASAQQVEEIPTANLKVNENGIILIPQPTDDPNDPLNWSKWKKLRVLFTVSLCAFTGLMSPLANISGFEAQAVVYHKTLTEISYTISASIAGMIVGAYIWLPISKLRRVGRSFTILWGLILTLLINIWSAKMTNESDYISFTISRLLNGMASAAPMFMGAAVVVETYFLHQRGKALTVFTTSLLLGSIISGTLSGFIAETDWTWQLWYNIILEGVSIIFALLWLDEPAWTRDEKVVYPVLPKGHLSRRLAIFCCGAPVMPALTFGEWAYEAAVPFLMLASPVTIITGAFIFVFFGWGVAKQTLLAVFLQTPVVAGGYGFSATQTALFTFSNWVAAVVAEFEGHMLNDRLPLWVCKRYGGGRWKPEYRLHALWIPGVIMPVALGLFGASLQYHLHYMVLALASFLINYAALVAAPITINYLVDSFRNLPSEATVNMNFYRTLLGLLVPFFIFPWQVKVGPGWVFGMAAFFTIASECLIVVLLIWGPQIRRYSLIKDHDQEEGLRVVREVVEKEV